MNIVAVMKNGEKIESMKMVDLFPTYKNEFDRACDYIEITDDLFTIRVATTLLLCSEGGKWYADVLCGDGQFKKWNGTIYNNVVYVDGVRGTLNDDTRKKYEAIIAARKSIMDAWHNEIHGGEK